MRPTRANCGTHCCQVRNLEALLRRECTVPTELVSRDWPLQVSYAVQVEQVLGRYYFKQLARWGHAVSYEQHRRHDVMQSGLEVLPTKIRENGANVVRFRMFWDAGNETYNDLLSKREWDHLGGAARGKQGDARGHVGVLLVLRERGPGSLGFVGTDVMHRLQREISDLAMDMATQAGGWRRAALGGMILQYQDKQVLLLNLEKRWLPVGLALTPKAPPPALQRDPMAEATPKLQEVKREPGAGYSAMTSALRSVGELASLRLVFGPSRIAA